MATKHTTQFVLDSLVVFVGILIISRNQPLCLWWRGRLFLSCEGNNGVEDIQEECVVVVVVVVVSIGLNGGCKRMHVGIIGLFVVGWEEENGNKEMKLCKLQSI